MAEHQCLVRWGHLFEQGVFKWSHVVLHGVAPVDYKWCTPGVVEVCATLVGAAVDRYVLTSIIAFFSSYVHLTWVVVWILRLVHTLR